MNEQRNFQLNSILQENHRNSPKDKNRLKKKQRKENHRFHLEEKRIFSRQTFPRNVNRINRRFVRRPFRWNFTVRTIQQSQRSFAATDNEIIEKSFSSSPKGQTIDFLSKKLANFSKSRKSVKTHRTIDLNSWNFTVIVDGENSNRSFVVARAESRIVDQQQIVNGARNTRDQSAFRLLNIPVEKPNCAGRRSNETEFELIVKRTTDNRSVELELFFQFKIFGSDPRKMDENNPEKKSFVFLPIWNFFLFKISTKLVDFPQFNDARRWTRQKKIVIRSKKTNFIEIGAPMEQTQC